MRRALLLLIGLGMATGCGADLWYFETRNLSGGPTTLIVVWSDSPVDEAESVRIVLDRLEVYGPQGVEVLTDSRRTFELLDLQHGQFAQLARTEVLAGAWDGLRFHLAPGGAALHSIRIGGATETLYFSTPGGHVIDVPYALTLVEEEETTVHVDFNVRMSVVQAGTEWLLTPRLRAVDPSTAGWLLGTVARSDGSPLALATVSAQQSGAEVLSARTLADGTFRLGPLPPGSYALLVTASGHAAGYVPDARVYAGTDSGGVVVSLGSSEGGAIKGAVPGSTAGRTVRILTDEGLVAVAGVDPVTGSFSLPVLPVGVYTVELWDAVGPIDAVVGVEVTAHSTTHVSF